MPRNLVLSNSLIFSITGASAVGLATLLSASSAAALTANTTATSSTATAANNSTHGYVFNVNTPITVTQLGVYDYFADGLTEAHEVGIWDSAGTLLISATIPVGTAATLDYRPDAFRWVNVSNVNLAVGNGYRIGAFYSTGADVMKSTAAMTTSPQITFVSGAFASGTSLSNPTGTISAGRLGPNFEFEPTPVPFAFNPLLGVGVFGLSRVRRAIQQKKRQASGVAV